MLLDPKAHAKTNGTAYFDFPDPMSTLSIPPTRASSAPPALYSNSDTLLPPSIPMSSCSAPTLDDVSLTHKGKPLQGKSRSANGDSTKATATNGFDPKMLLSPKAALKHTRDDTTPSTAANDYDKIVPMAEADRGMGNMIEKMHKVGKREDEPRKRIKTSHVPDEEEEEHDRKKNQSKFHGVNGGGVIGDYVKTKREEGLNKAGPPAGVVDLTNGKPGK